MAVDALSWLYAAGVAQGVFLIFALSMLRARNSAARWFFTACIFFFTLLLAEEFLETAGLPSGFGAGLALEFAVWPLLYLFVVELAGDDPAPQKHRWAHFVPFGLAIVWVFYLNVFVEGDNISLSAPETRNLVAATVFAKIIYFSIYATLILRRPLLLAGKPAPMRQALRWVRIWLWVLCAAYATVAASFLAFYFEAPWAPDSDHVGGVVLVLGVFSLGYFTIYNRHVFDVKPSGAPAGLRANDAVSLTDKARAHLDATKAHLDPDFNLRALAAGLNVTESALSEALNIAPVGGFYALVNERRLNAFLSLLDDPANRDCSILRLAFDAGFSSKATFYRCFRNAMAMTPKQYRARLEAQRSEIEDGSPGFRSH